MNIFQHETYKAFLEAQIDSNRQARGYQGQLAVAAGCQPSFLSRVLKSDAHLTRDQAAELCRFWRLNAGETEYFISLLDLERAGSEYLKNLIRDRLASFRNKASDISEAVQKATLSSAESQMTYYSSWYWAAIHIATTIPTLQDPSAIAKRLNLDLRIVLGALSSLAQMGLIEKKRSGKWMNVRTDLHVSNNSPMNEINHVNWRQRAVLDIQNKNLGSIHYSSVFAMSKKDAELIRKQIFEMLTKTREAIGPSKEEDLFCLNCDFFEL